MLFSDPTNLRVCGVAWGLGSGLRGTGMAKGLGWKEAKLALGEGRISVLGQDWPKWSMEPEQHQPLEEQ